MTRKDTLTNEADDWLKDVRKNAPTHCIIGICGNKIDLTNEIQVTFQDLLDFCQKNGINHYKEASAKTNVGITEIFEKLIVELDENKDKIAELTDAFTRNTF